MSLTVSPTLFDPQSGAPPSVGVLRGSQQQAPALHHQRQQQQQQVLQRQQQNHPGLLQGQACMRMQPQEQQKNICRIYTSRR
ncbi:hypothetical protein Emed_007162 [Eimeria media]